MARTQTRRLGRPPASVSAETRQRIVEASEKCFGQYGYDKTTNKDVANEAGLTTGALYHYFDSKQALFAAVFLERHTQVAESFREAAATADTAIGKLCAILDRAVELNMADPHIARFVSVAEIEISRHPEFEALLDTAHRQNDMASFYGQIVRDGIDAGELPPDTDVRAVVNMVVAVTLGFAQFAAYRGRAIAHAQAVEAFKLLLRGELFQSSSTHASFQRRRAALRSTAS